MIDRILIAIGRIFLRFHRWTAAAIVLSFARQLDAEQRLRFSYACMRDKQHRPVRNAFVRVLRRGRDQDSAENLWFAYTAWCLGRLNLAALLFRRTARLFAGTPAEAIGLREADFALTSLHGGLRRELSRLVEALTLTSNQNAPLILVPVSRRYFELYKLWKRQVDQHLRGAVVLLALDQATLALAAQTGVQTIDLTRWFDFDANARIEYFTTRHIWMLRVMILRELASRGHTILSLDLDAILLGDVMGMLAEFSSADLVVQRDYSIPIDVARELGFVLCCGFLYLRPSPAVLSFLDRYVDQTLAELDDQTAINHLLAQSGLKDRTQSPQAMTFQSLGLRWACPDASLVSREVDSGSIVRHFDQKRQSLDITGIARAMHLDLPQ